MKAIPRDRKRSGLEHTFLLLWRAMGGTSLQEEVVFAPPRKWRFDFAVERALMYRVDGAVVPNFRFGPGKLLPENVSLLTSPIKIAIEIEGGVWSGGRHTRGKGYESDCEKYNTAVLLGWRVFRLTGGMLTDRHIRPIIELCK